MTNDFTNRLVLSLGDNTAGALPALTDALVADPKARSAIEASMFKAGGSASDPIGEIETLILNSTEARKALEARLFTPAGEFLDKVFAEGTSQVVDSLLSSVASGASKKIVAKLLDSTHFDTFAANLAVEDEGTVREIVDRLRDGAKPGLVADEVFADPTARADVEARFRADGLMVELITSLADPASRDAFVRNTLANPAVKDEIVAKLSATPDALIDNVLKDHAGQLLDALLAFETLGGARDQLFTRIAVPPKLQTLAAAAIRDGAAAATSAGTSQDGRRFLHPTVNVLAQSNEFLDDFAATLPTLPGQAAISHFLSDLIGDATAPASFTKTLTDHLAAQDKFVDVIAAIIAADLPGLNAKIKAKVP